MSKYDSKYSEVGAEGSRSHVRGIIQQLNEEKPSKEKSREVVVRPDGTKVIRVTKKRRVLVSDEEKRKAGRRSFLWILMGAFGLCGLFVAVLLFRMSTLAGEAYAQQQADSLKSAWGAETVAVSGSGIEGMDFHLSGVVADFPEGSLIRRVVLSDISASLDIATFFSGVLKGDKLSVARAEIVYDAAAETLSIPLYQGEDLWHFSRVECDDFNVKSTDGEASAVSVNNAHAYLYYPRRSDRSSCALVLSGGAVQLRGMQNIRLKDAKFYIARSGVEEFSLRGTTDRATETESHARTALAVSGRLNAGDSLSGPFEFDADNMRFAEFTQGRLENIFTARTVLQAVGRDRSRARVVLPFHTEKPVFSGEFALKEICLKGFPVQTALLRHMEAEKRKNYLPPVISRGHVSLKTDGENMTLELPDEQVVERDLLHLRGSLSLNAANEISGSMEFGLPAILTHAEYADGKADPIFREDAGTAWVKTELSGTVNIPSDNSAQLEAEAEEARSSRPGRLQLDALDFDKVANQLKRDREALQSVDGASGAESPASVDAASDSPAEPQMKSRSLDSLDSPLDVKSIFD
ncbi:MAG: hypothetical protein MJ051_02765 [Akkermansia sp.]|nr:hypothetical protein [Akkermansia sp.]